MHCYIEYLVSNVPSEVSVTFDDGLLLVRPEFRSPVDRQCAIRFSLLKSMVFSSEKTVDFDRELGTRLFPRGKVKGIASTHFQFEDNNIIDSVGELLPQSIERLHKSAHFILVPRKRERLEQKLDCILRNTLQGTHK